VVAQLAQASQLRFGETTPLTAGTNYQPPTYNTTAPALFNQDTKWSQTSMWNSPGQGQSSVIFVRADGAVYMQFILQGTNVAQVYWYQQGSSADLDPITITGGTYNAYGAQAYGGTPPAFPSALPGKSWYVSTSTAIGQWAFTSLLSAMSYLSPNGAAQDGTGVVMNGTQTEWLFQPTAPGSSTGYILLGANPGLALTPQSPWEQQVLLEAYSPSYSIVGSTPSTSNPQLWTFQSAGNGEYYLQNNGWSKTQGPRYLYVKLDDDNKPVNGSKVILEEEYQKKNHPNNITWKKIGFVPNG
jgi:hypothetical protein